MARRLVGYRPAGRFVPAVNQLSLVREFATRHAFPARRFLATA